MGFGNNMVKNRNIVHKVAKYCSPFIKLVLDVLIQLQLNLIIVTISSNLMKYV